MFFFFSPFSKYAENFQLKKATTSLRTAPDADPEWKRGIKCRVAGAAGQCLLNERGFDSRLQPAGRRWAGYPRVREISLHSRQNSCLYNSTHITEIALLKLTCSWKGLRYHGACWGPALGCSLTPPSFPFCPLDPRDPCEGVPVSCFLI